MKTVTRADQSPMNDKQWLVVLECGHERWLTSNKSPAEAKCYECERECRAPKRTANGLPAMPRLPRLPRTPVLRG